MVGLVYSNPDLAIRQAKEYFSEVEENVYVCPVKYPSGVEYHLKLNKDVINGCSLITKYELESTHHFKKLPNAMNAISYFRKMGKRYIIKKKIDDSGPYKEIKYYYLCST